MLLLFKILLIWFLFTACEAPKDTIQDEGRSLALSSDKMPPSKWKSVDVFPIKLKYAQNFDETEIDALENAATSWEKGVDYKMTFFAFDNTTPKEVQKIEDYEDDTLGIYKLNPWPSELPKSALAVTQIFGDRVNSGEDDEYIRIDHADILINYEIYTFTTDFSWGYDLHTVVVHEMGHFLGLYHDNTSNEESIMYPTISRFDTGRDPKEKDIDNILAKYSLRSDTAQVPQPSLSPTQRVSITLELYPGGKEIIRYKNDNGANETIIKHCSH